jgi:hypothetical protein
MLGLFFGGNMLTFSRENPKIKDARKLSFICETGNISNDTELLIEHVIVYCNDRKVTKNYIIEAFSALKQNIGFEFNIFNGSLNRYQEDHKISLAQLKECAPKIRLEKVYFVYT